MTSPSAPLVVVGDALLDRDLDGRVERLAPDAPVPVVDQPVGRARPGGAGLAALIAVTDRPVVLVTAIGDDAAGDELRRLLHQAQVHVVDVGLHGRTAEKVRVRADGHPLVRLDYGDALAPVGALGAEATDALASAAAILVSDYGRGMTAQQDVRDALARHAAATPIVWDPHARGSVPVANVRVATPNRVEAAAFAAGLPGAPPSADAALPAVVARARALVKEWHAAGVAVTLGARGAVLVSADGTPLAVPATRVHTGDPCGAGDCFAARAATCLAAGALPSEAITEAVAAASVFVASGGAGAVDERVIDLGAAANGVRPRGGHEDACSLARAVQARGGTVVATGGCFDLLHAGHVRMLEAARALGDCLIVCLNSDASVRRLKGPTRPVTPAADRAAVLLALGCVDAVAVFDEDTPEAVLDRLRPDLWAKGADYKVEDLPEARLVASWGGQAVVLPYLDGRSTTRLIELATKGRTS